jgi:hypothetical protein
MKDNYEYVDPDYTYSDPRTGVLRNLGNIDDAKLLSITLAISSSSPSAPFSP